MSVQLRVFGLCAKAHILGMTEPAAILAGLVTDRAYQN